MECSFNKWCLNRAGLLNYWYYDDEEFQFADGRLLLRGGNGSGKSVTMQSLITVLLDGVKSPDRLDSFGSRSRRMEDYLLGEKEIVDRDERTGYLYLEYKRQSSEQYLTTGIGLQARRNSGLDFWGFVITDNRRIRYDMTLYKPEISPEDGSKQHVPLTRSELERLIGGGGQVVRSQKEYMELVNRHIFGFATIDQYQELMKLLIQLRSPKLSKDFKPSVIYEILNESLPSLSDEELRPLSDTIESMERTKLQLEQLERDRQSLLKLCRYYDEYNQFVFFEKAELAQKAKQRLLRLNRESEALTQQIKEDELKVADLKLHQHELEQELFLLQRERGELEQHDVFRAEQQKQEQERRLDGLMITSRGKDEQLIAKQRREKEERQQMHQYEANAEADQMQMTEIMQDLDAAASEVGFESHMIITRAFKEQNQAFSFTAWRQNSRQYMEKLRSILELLQRQSETRKLRERMEQELAEERHLLDEYRAEHRRLEQKFIDCRDQLLADFYQWRQQFETALPMEQEEMRQVAQCLQGLYEGRSWNDVKAPVEAAYGRRLTAINRELGLTNAKISQLEEEEQTLTQELNQWRNQLEPEPERLPETRDTRILLTDLDIPYMPFYAAVEFQTQVPPEIRERIEAALTEMGILDALIIPENRLRDIPAGDNFGMVIHPQPQIMTATLADYLIPTPDGKGITWADIDAVLRTIVIDNTLTWSDASTAADQTTVVPETGTYRMGITSGRAPHRQAAIYIGKQARQEYRRQQMSILEQKLLELGQEQEKLYAVCNELRQQLAKVGQAMESFLAEKTIRELYQDKAAKLNDVGRQEKRVEQFDSRLREVISQFQALRELLQTSSAGGKLPATEEAYREALKVFDEYRHGLQELEISWHSYENNQSNTCRTRERLTEIESDVDGLKGELYLLQEQINGLKMEIVQIERRMQEMGAAELRERVREVTERLAAIPEESKVNTTKVVSLEKELEINQNRLQVLAAKNIFYEQLGNCWQRVLDEELHLGLVDIQDSSSSGIAAFLQQNEKILKPDKLDRFSITERLVNNFHLENNVLMEYRMQLEPVTVDGSGLPPLPESEEPDDGIAAELERFLEKAGRQIITLDYEGRRQSPYQVARVLETQIADEKAILSDKDKELYEEVIMNSIGRIISRRILAAQQWVADMNKLMGERDNSSGLKFKLEWKARLAEQENQLDTGDLVRLLRAEPSLLKEEDLQKMVRYFQQRIEHAKQASADSVSVDEAVTFQRAVREVLDYRQWFQFKLYFEQSGITWRELSDKMFFKFSGGEKAMAMYIPLFSAVYSRYQEARDDAPYIITLDEAFAGVDENNIRDTFALVEQLGFNYIMNSQALWGDYDVVPALAICELIRPKNAPYVTVVRYYWNGRIRALMDHDEIFSENEDLIAATGEVS
ncbi:MAG TPA: TIGR02680 family protein [Firmicutes bacterium]|jgi:uncharacterized protein (TIGR02680 family)|nr:TIGR02680 family protein [Bacillota bacterium]